MEFRTCQGCCRRSPHDTPPLHAFECYLAERLWTEKHRRYSARIELDTLVRKERDMLDEHRLLTAEVVRKDIAIILAIIRSGDTAAASEAHAAALQALLKFEPEVDAIKQETKAKRDVHDEIQVEISRLEATLNKLLMARDEAYETEWVWQLLESRYLKDREHRERLGREEAMVSCVVKGPHQGIDDQHVGSARAITPNVVGPVGDAGIKREEDESSIQSLAPAWTRPLSDGASNSSERSPETTHSTTASSVTTHSGPRRSNKTWGKLPRYEPY